MIRRIKDSRWKKARRRCFERDNYRCQDCLSPRHLECHHVTPLHIDPSQDQLDLAGLVTVCKDCHFKRHPSRLRSEAALEWEALVARLVSRY